MKRRPAQLNRTSSQVSEARPGAPSSLLVQIEKPIYGGSFLARDEGKAVFVPLVLPGEQARVRVVEENRGYATAELEQLVNASAERVSPKCPHFGPCGGCHYQHAEYEIQLRMKEAVLRETLERGGVKPPEEIAILAGQPWEYRNRIRLAFDAHGDPGYRGRRSHAVVPVRECPISAPLLVRSALTAAELLKQFAQALRPSEMALFCNADETALLISLFVASAAKIGFEEFAAELQKRIPELAGAELILESTNQQPRTVAQWGAPSLAYRAAGVDYRVDHGAFFQVNRRLVDALAERVTAGYSGAFAWDLFAGVGLFSRKLTERFSHVVAVESAPTALDALAANLQGTSGVAARAAALAFLRGHSTGQRPELVVVDPPRMGLGADMTAVIREIAPAALVYVSCDPATLARDLRVLLAGSYSIESITLVDLFPQTFHLETVVRMRLP